MKTERTTTLMEFVERSDIGYHPAFTSTSPRRHMLTLDGNVWNDMGRPETITVTIEPGDKLNEGVPS